MMYQRQHRSGVLRRPEARTMSLIPAETLNDKRTSTRPIERAYKDNLCPTDAVMRPHQVTAVSQESRELKRRAV